jgi:phosphohistidine phosphatase
MNDTGGRRTLVLMRHSKAEQTADDGGGDSSRRLSDRGRADAAAAGRFLAEVGLVPDLALISSSTRTRETWQEVREASGSEAVEEVTAALYGASVDRVIETIRLVDPEAEVVIVVGHNPEAEVLGAQLSDGAGSDDAELSLREGFPTSALAVYDVPVPWSEIDTGMLTVQRVHVARG